MTASGFWLLAGITAPPILMGSMALLTRVQPLSVARLWQVMALLSGSAFAVTGLTALAGSGSVPGADMIQASPLGLGLAMLVQLLGTVICRFSARYLQGEEGQRRYIAALAAVLASVHLLLLADHWLVLIVAWAAVGMALEPLLCFYPDRPFARLAAHKKRIADRLADVLLVGAAGAAWLEVGSGSFPALWSHVAQYGASTALQASAVALVLAVVLRTALLPVHGWLIQVMEAPTPVSALLHAGVVNLGGFVLIRFAPLLEQAAAARGVLMLFGLGTAVLAGMVMLTRISIKVRLAWSTVAQMGFMLLECALGLYTLAALHLIGHSLYKAHAFLSASTVVRHTRIQALHRSSTPAAWSLVLAPCLTIGAVLLIQAALGLAAWPWWWSCVLGLAWAPLLWVPPWSAGSCGRALLDGVLIIAVLTVAALLAHGLPLGIHDAPAHALGPAAVAGIGTLYAWLALLQARPAWLSSWRRWSYAGFYVDEFYTRVALQLWPARWTPEALKHPRAGACSSTLADVRH